VLSLEVLAKVGNEPEGEPLATEGGPLANTQKKMGREKVSGCGFLY